MLIFLCWLVYTCSYIGKLNYAANITQMESFYAISHAEAGLVSTCFFFAYGLGAIADGCGWTVVFWVLIGVCAFACLVAFVYAILKKALSKKEE